MAQPKGSTGNPNGRPIGSKNIVSEEIRETINSFLSNNIATIQQSFDSLEPYQKIQSIIKLLDYSIPRLKTIESNTRVKEEPKIGAVYNLSVLTTEELLIYKDLLEKVTINLNEDYLTEKYNSKKHN